MRGPLIDNFTPDEWVRLSGGEGVNRWPALPVWDSVSALQAALRPLDDLSRATRAGVICRAFVTAYIDSACSLLMPAAWESLRAIDRSIGALSVRAVWSDIARGKLVLDLPSALVARCRRLSFHFLQSARDLASALEREWQINEEFDEPLSGIECAGDIHARGCVCVLMRGGVPWRVYKPRPMELDLLLSDVFAYLREHAPLSTPHHPTSFDRGLYGFQQFVGYSSPQGQPELDTFFRRYGGLVAASYALAATDLHSENVRSTRESPMIIDAECVVSFDPRREVFLDRAVFSPRTSSVLDSLLLPNWTPGAFGAPSYDVSALGFASTEERRVAVRSPRLIDGEWDLNETVRLSRRSESLPETDPSAHPWADHREAILEGFEDLASALTRERTRHWMTSRVAGLRTTTRVIMRSTSTYSSTLKSARTPVALNPAREEGESPAGRFVKWVRDCENAQLDQGLIPLFERSLSDGSLRSGGAELTLPGPGPVEVLTERLDAIDDERMSVQASIVGEALDEALWAAPAQTVEWGAAGNTPVGRSRLEDNIHEIVRTIVARVGTPSARSRWVAHRSLLDGRRQLALPEAGVYDGEAGLVFALGVASLASATSTPTFETLNESLLANLERWSQRIGRDNHRWRGGFSQGPIGALHAVCEVASLRADAATLGRVRSIVLRLRECAYDGEGIDYLNGASGVLNSLRRLRHILSTSALDDAIDSASRTVMAGIAQWVQLDRPPLLGFAHGLSGIAFAVGACSQESVGTAERETARLLLSWEDAMLAGTRSDARLPREAKASSSTWCRGAVGRQISRLACGIHEPAVLHEVPHMVFAGDSLPVSFCHGALALPVVMGAAEYVAEFGHQDLTRVRQAVHRHATQSGEVKTSSGLNSDLGLFNGLSGLLVFLCSIRDDAYFDVGSLTYRPGASWL